MPCDYPRVNIQKNLKEVPTTKQPIPYVSKKDGDGKTAKSQEPQVKDTKKEEAKTKQQTEHHEKKVTVEEKKVPVEEKKVVHEEKTGHHEDQTRHPAPKHSRHSSDDHQANQSLNVTANISLPSNPEDAAEAYVGNLIERSEANLVNT